ncbi:hypothetical protein R5R35_003184 [Gryllus longicercus]|uniref:glutathione transferase n=1 Tax=Gryllus longicercus TaxID=2509291 RepID=A0AAN9VIS5_9ORTH
MAPQYKFTYFDFRALGEFIRFLFKYGDIDFEDNRLDPNEWPKLKPSYPNGKLPLLEFDGKTLNQSTAIGRFIAKKIGLAGSNDWEAAQIDATVENLNDLRMAFAKVIWEVDDASKPEEKEKFLKETVPLFLPRLEAQVKTNGGYFVGGKLSWADIYLAAYHETFNHFFKDMFSPYPALQGVIDKVHAIPSIKAYVSKRPKTDI